MAWASRAAALAWTAVDARPIGMFDSGFGGLTVARAVIDLLPSESLVYVGDTGRFPYGPRSLDEVRGFARQISRWLVDTHDVKMIVVACNTASSSGLDELQADLDVPLVGVIDAGVRAVVSATRNGHVGVIGTVGTIGSGAYQWAVAEEHGGVKLTCAACPGFVEFVERGETGGDQVHVLAERLLAAAQDAGIDALLLGCTHYPYLARTIADVVGREVVLVSSADETAFEVADIVGRDGPVVTPGHHWYSSGDVDRFRQLGRRLLGPELDQAEAWPGGTSAPTTRTGR